jgi:hypothetical protein
LGGNLSIVAETAHDSAAPSDLPLVPTKALSSVDET